MAIINWLGEGWANVGLRLDKDRACYVGATFSQRQEKRCPDVYLQRWPNVTAYVGPTLDQWIIAIWERLWQLKMYESKPFLDLNIMNI